MESHVLISIALIGIVGSSCVLAAEAPKRDKALKRNEKCYGLPKTSQHVCASKLGTHACAPQTQQGKASADFQYVPTGTCLKLGGTLVRKK